MNTNERLRYLRKDLLGLTLEQFGGRIGLKKNSLSQIENGKNALTDQVFKSICREFNVNENWLRNGFGEMFTEKSTFSLDDYANANHLTDREREIVRGFMELDPSVRNAIYDIFSSASTENSTYNSVPDTAEELEAQYPPVDETNENAG